MLGTQDLGQVYFEPIKDKHGNALLLLLKDMNTCSNLDGVRWTQLCKLQLQRKSISSPEEPTALDMLLITLHVRSTRQTAIWAPLLFFLHLHFCLFHSSQEGLFVMVNLTFNFAFVLHRRKKEFKALYQQ